MSWLPLYAAACRGTQLHTTNTTIAHNAQLCVITVAGNGGDWHPSSFAAFTSASLESSRVTISASPRYAAAYSEVHPASSQIALVCHLQHTCSLSGAW